MVRLGLWAAVTAMLLAANGAQAACQIAKGAEMPVTMHGLSPWTSAQINGQAVSFILDSGADYSTITPTKAAELKLNLEPAPWRFSVIGVGGETSRVSLTTVKTFTVIGVPVSNLQFLVVGQGSDGSAGLLGQNLLHLHDVEYDLGHGSVWLIKPLDCGRTPLAYWAKDIPYNAMPLVEGAYGDLHTYGYVTLNGVRIKATFDTGASASIITTQAAARAGLTPQMQGANLIGSSVGVGARTVRNWSVPVASFKIGDEEIKATQMQIADSDLGGSDMLLGADFFLSHHVYVANSQGMIYFTYNGGNVFDLTAPSTQTERLGELSARQATGAATTTTEDHLGANELKTAEGFSRRGSALAARHQYEAAITDFSKAIELEPAGAGLYYQRALAYLDLKQNALAMTDLDETIRRQPDNVDALVVRAELRIAQNDRTGAGQDLDKASSNASVQADVRFRLAGDDNQLDRFDASVSELDRWIAAHPDEAHTAAAYNSRCWARANLGRDLDRALDDCNRSIWMVRDAESLDSRGLVHLRRGEYDRAIEDYDAAITLQPNLRWSLYGRGLAKLYKGDKAGGDADIAAAKVIAPRIAETARERGIIPPPSAHTNP